LQSEALEFSLGDAAPSRRLPIRGTRSPGYTARPVRPRPQPTLPDQNATETDNSEFNSDYQRIRGKVVRRKKQSPAAAMGAGRSNSTSQNI
jgi:hypothetical protein